MSLCWLFQGDSITAPATSNCVCSTETRCGNALKIDRSQPRGCSQDEFEGRASRQPVCASAMAAGNDAGGGGAPSWWSQVAELLKRTADTAAAKARWVKGELTDEDVQRAFATSTVGTAGCAPSLALQSHPGYHNVSEYHNFYDPRVVAHDAVVSHVTAWQSSTQLHRPQRARCNARTHSAPAHSARTSCTPLHYATELMSASSSSTSGSFHCANSALVRPACVYL